MQSEQSSNLTSNTLKQSPKITEENILNFLSGYKNLALTKIKKSPPWMEEMVEYRAFLCKPCLDNGKCLYCGCSTPGLFYAPLKKDPQKRWPTILNEEAWNQFKESDPEYKKYIEIKNEYNNRSSQGLLGTESES